MIDSTATTTRRTALGKLAAWTALATVPLAGEASAQTAVAAKKPLARPSASNGPYKALIAAAKKCGDVGEVCRKHCIKLSAAGDVSIAECMRTVSAMLPVCGAAGKLASQDAKRLKDLLKVCVDICADCEAECRKHEFHHRECKACAEACASMIKESKAVIGA